MADVHFYDSPGPDWDLWGWDGAGWYFWDETGAMAHGPYPTKMDALQALKRYGEALNALRSDGPLHIHLTEREDDQ